VNSPLFSLRFSGQPLFGEPRVAVSVSKKVLKSAVARNGVRRRVYAALRSYIPELSPRAFLFVAKSGAEKLKGDRLKLEIKKLLEESKAFVSKS